MDAYGPNTEVVRVIVKKFNDLYDLADTVTIYTGNFLDENGQYDGSYKEDFIQQTGGKLKISADILMTADRIRSPILMPVMLITRYIGTVRLTSG